MSIELNQAAQHALDALEARCGTNADERQPGGVIEALRTAIQQAESESLTDTFVQTVPDKCDRILWRGRYLHLPIPYPAPGVPDDVVRDAISTVREQYRGTDWGKAAECICDAIDAAMLAAKDASA